MLSSSASGLLWFLGPSSLLMEINYVKITIGEELLGKMVSPSQKDDYFFCDKEKSHFLSSLGAKIGFKYMLKTDVDLS